MTIIKIQKDFMDKFDISEKVQKWFFKVNLFIWNISKFLGALFILNRIYGRVGFEGAIMLQLLIIIFMFRSFFKSQKQESQLKQCKKK